MENHRELEILGTIVSQTAEELYNGCSECPERAECIMNPKCKLLIEASREWDGTEYHWRVEASLFQGDK